MKRTFNKTLISQRELPHKEAMQPIFIFLLSWTEERADDWSAAFWGMSHNYLYLRITLLKNTLLMGTKKLQLLHHYLRPTLRTQSRVYIIELKLISSPTKVLIFRFKNVSFSVKHYY